MRKILFVDDEAKILEGLRRMLRPMRNEWEMAFVTSGAEALETLAARHFDAVVSDMRMPGMNGAQLLAEVKTHHPQVVRIMLSGYSEQELSLKSAGPAQQFLSKPCDSGAIRETVDRSCALRDLLAGEALQALISQMQVLPSLPSLYTELVGELQSPNTAIKKIGELISQYPSIAEDVLAVANSGFFGVRQPVASPMEAINFLGLGTVMTLALAIEVFSQFKKDCLPSSFISALWSHSLRVGSFARRIAQVESLEPDMGKNAFTAGLLHNVGHLVMAANLPEQYNRMLELVRTGQLSYEEAERQVFGVTHAEVGAYLLKLWGLPMPIAEAVAYHHRPEECVAQGFVPLTAVHIAAAMDSEMQETPLELRSVTIDLNYLTKLGMTERLLLHRTNADY